MISNSDLKYFEKLKQKKYRDEENKFLIEGVHLIEECLKSDIYRSKLEKIFVREDFNNDKAFESIKNSDHYAEIDFIPVSKFSKLSETVNSQGIIGLISKPDVTINRAKKENENLIVIAIESINDPGNLGTIIRNCHWFGIDELIIGNNSVDVYNSKVIRSSQGALFFVNIKNEVDFQTELENYSSDNFEILVTDLNAEKHLTEIEIDKAKNYVIVFGGESTGVTESISGNENYSKMKIKGYTDCESLNVAVTSGIIMYEFRK